MIDKFIKIFSDISIMGIFGILLGGFLIGILVLILCIAIYEEIVDNGFFGSFLLISLLIGLWFLAREIKRGNE